MVRALLQQDIRNGAAYDKDGGNNWPPSESKTDGRWTLHRMVGPGVKYRTAADRWCAGTANAGPAPYVQVSNSRGYVDKYPSIPVLAHRGLPAALRSHFVHRSLALAGETGRGHDLGSSRGLASTTGDLGLYKTHMYTVLNRE